MYPTPLVPTILQVPEEFSESVVTVQCHLQKKLPIKNSSVYNKTLRYIQYGKNEKL